MNSLRTIIIILLFLLISSIGSATNYYVSSSSGNDNADGRSESTAWKTVSKVNKMSFSPGDIISFKKGDVWRESLNINNSGSASAYIVFTSYGSGAKPQFLGSLPAANWTNQGNNVWKSSTSVADPYSGSYKGEIYFTGSDGNIIWGHIKKSVITDLAHEYDWTWASNNIYVYSTTDPGSKYKAIEVSQNDVGISLNDKQYIKLDGFDIKYWHLAGVKGQYPAIHISGLTISNSEIGYIGTKESLAAFGLSIYYSDCLIQNNTIHDCGRRGISINTDAAANAVIENVTIEKNTLYNGFHTTGIDLGNTGSSTFNNFIIRDNLIYDDPARVIDGIEETESVGMLIGNNTSGVRFTNIYIYNNIIKYSKLKGLDISGTTSLNIYNNVFYGVNPTAGSFGGLIYINSSSAGVIIKNNIFFNTMVNSINRYFPCIYRQTGASITVDYNLYYMTDPNEAFVNMGGLYLISQWSTYKSSTGHDAHSSIPGDPLFVSSSDYHLQTGSPAIGAGIQIAEVKTDFEGVPYSNPPNLGCFATSGRSGVLSYVSSAVENATPSLITMTYNLSLADIIPAASAFTVWVNSVPRPVTVVTISGNNVLLTLSKPILYGDFITVSYTRPAGNPLQSTLGSQAESISSSTVTNKIISATGNSPPVPVINYNTSIYSGFIGEIDASDSYDLNNDPLAFQWTSSDDVSISSTGAPKIQFLAPLVQEAGIKNFNLNLSDGEAIQNQVIPITILPYKPDLSVATVLKVEASDFYGSDYPENIIDNNPETKWSSDGIGKWLILRLSKPFRLDHFGIIFPPGQMRSSYFDIFASKDTNSWDPIIIGATSCNFSGNYQVFVVPESKTSEEYSYVKLTGHGNSEDSWNDFSEFRTYGLPHTDFISIKIYPNPAHEIINLSIEYPSNYSNVEIGNLSSLIRILDLTGQIVMEKLLDQGTTYTQIPIYLASGIYIIQMISDGTTVSNGKIVVVK